MENSLYIALSRQAALRQELDVVANNVANLNTSGFKASSTTFREYLYRGRGTEPFSEVQTASTVTDFAEGPLVTTNNPMDMAINGRGFFQVQTPVGVRYTRAGHFRIDADNQLVTSAGYPVLDEDGVALELPDDGLIDLSVASDGTVSALAGNINANNQQVIGKLGIVDFDDLQTLTHTEGGYFIAPQPGAVLEAPVVVQGALEQSNVLGVVEMTNMIEVLRAYQGQQRLIDGENERIRQLIRQLGGLQQS